MESQKKSLAKLVAELEVLEAKLDDQPEITAEDVKQWSFANDLLQTKVDSWAEYLDLVDSQIFMAEQQKKRADQSLKRKKALLKSLHGYLKRVLESRPDHRLEGESGLVMRLMKNPPKLETKFSLESYSTQNIIPEFVVGEMPNEFVDIVKVKVLNKDRVKAELKAGGEVPHCTIIQEMRVDLR